MQRLVRAELDLDIGGELDLILAVTLAAVVTPAEEVLTIAQHGIELTPTELIDQVGTRLHRLRVQPGPVQVRYEAVVEQRATLPDTPELDCAVYLRPSRYAPSDAVFAQARRQFGSLRGAPLLAAVEEFVATAVTYSPGLSQGTDSAVTTLATGQGVCRDYAHLVIALLRAMDVPARYVACYAPGLVPMDFHAVAEAYVDGQWHVLDATRLSNRSGLLRIATGRDAADCAFLSYYGANLILDRMFVDATAVGDVDDVAAASDPSRDERAALVTLS
ncbi:transglutaminase family protein [Microbacterium sp. 179-B 1A2 NHS]|uniref:transglutaminase-like domain-containing protein n=1 Tax=Microbacterium sp. 179-B 1A2 NHS TaxID=3142383 RepID=UPI0039A08A51